MLLLDAALWSGFKKQMELAESFLEPLITVNILLFFLFFSPLDMVMY
jgi:hypothetical protein